MSRIQLKFPEQIQFKTMVPLRITDFNYGNHLGNDSMLSVIHEVRMQYFNHIGCTELDFFGSAIIMTDVAIVYKAEGFYGDELNFEVSVADVNKYGFDLYYKASKTVSQKTICEAKTGIVCFDYKSHKIQELPVAFVKKLI